MDDGLDFLLSVLGRDCFLASVCRRPLRRCLVPHTVTLLSGPGIFGSFSKVDFFCGRVVDVPEGHVACSLSWMKDSWSLPM